MFPRSFFAATFFAAAHFCGPSLTAAIEPAFLDLETHQAEVSLLSSPVSVIIEHDIAALGLDADSPLASNVFALPASSTIARSPSRTTSSACTANAPGTARPRGTPTLRTVSMSVAGARPRIAIATASPEMPDLRRLDE